MPSAVVAVAFLVLAIIYISGDLSAYQTVLRHWGVAAFRFPFVDIHGVLTAVQCHRLGVDVYATNPCDTLGRVHNYSPLFLLLAAFPVTGDWTVPVGLTLDIGFIAALLLLPPARDARAACLICAAALSTMVAYALERCNVDIALFLIIFAGLLLLPQHPRIRWLGYAAILLATVLKYYPAILLVLALRERTRIFWRVAVVAAAVLLLFFAVEGHDVRRTLSHIPVGVFFDEMFGARNLPYGLAATLHWPKAAAIALQAAFVLATAAAGLRIATIAALAPACAALSAREKLFLLSGCLLIVGCFLAGESAGYRGIYLLLTLPGLAALARITRGHQVVWLFRAAVALTLAVLWANAARANLDYSLAALGVAADAQWIVGRAFWLVRELAWWSLAALLSGITFGLLRQTETVRAALALWPSRPGGPALAAGLTAIRRRAPAAPALPACRHGWRR